MDEKLQIIANTLETDTEKISEDKVLSEISEWDSFGMIKIIAMLDKHYNQTITMEDIKSFNTVGDLLARMK
jgi:acyl carrier protein